MTTWDWRTAGFEVDVEGATTYHRARGDGWAVVVISTELDGETDWDLHCWSDHNDWNTMADTIPSSERDAFEAAVWLAEVARSEEEAA